MELVRALRKRLFFFTVFVTVTVFVYVYVVRRLNGDRALTLECPVSLLGSVNALTMYNLRLLPL